MARGRMGDDVLGQSEDRTEAEPKNKRGIVCAII